MYKKMIVFVLSVFLVGMVAGGILAQMAISGNSSAAATNAPKPQETKETLSDNTILNSVSKAEPIKNLNPRDKPSPQSRISKDSILVYDNQVILKIKDPQWAVFTNSKSMDPVIDSESKALEIVPQSESELKVGDIVAYQSRIKDAVVAHRIVETAYDAQGWYAKMKGDNNDYMDPEKVRFEQIKRVVVAIIY